MSLEYLKKPEAFLEIWRIHRATRWFQTERLVRGYMNQSSLKSMPEARATLEQIRDHVDCGIPWLHELIAFHARMDGDEPVRRLGGPMGRIDLREIAGRGNDDVNTVRRNPVAGADVGERRQTCSDGLLQ
jgi:hypothetical protein